MYLLCCKVPSLNSSWIMYIYPRINLRKLRASLLFSHGRYLSLQPNIICNSLQKCCICSPQYSDKKQNYFLYYIFLIYFVFIRHNPIIIFKGTSSNTTTWRRNPNKNLEEDSDTNQEKKILIWDSKSRKGLDVIYSSKFVRYLFSLVPKDCLNP